MSVCRVFQLFFPWVLNPERDNVVYWKTNGKINNDLQFEFTQLAR